MALKTSMLAALIGATFISLSTASAQEPAGAAAFASHCGYCHTTTGDESMAPNLVRKAPAEFSAFDQIVRSGRSGASGDMPAFDQQSVSEADLRLIHAYLLALRQREAESHGR